MTSGPTDARAARAHDELPPRVQSERELRIALAMRGGVSLAVWMGGACREMARLREAGQQVRKERERERAKQLGMATPPTTDAGEPGPPEARTASIYEELLKYYSYDGVEIDVLAGTSAGGLNGALMGAHLVYGMPFDDSIRNIWIAIGHLEVLSRDPGNAHPPSLLYGDKRFYAKMAERLARHLEESKSGSSLSTPSQNPVRLILTATRLAPRDDMVRPRLGPLLAVGQSRAHFRFRHRPGLTQPTGPGGALSDFGKPDIGGGLSPAQLRTLECLAYAARTTSSFPGAFEPARPFVAVPGELKVNPETQLPVDFRGISSETGMPDPDLSGEVELIDGGLLDNIPITWAVRAIAAAPSDRPVDRWLMYLQPVPPLRPDPTRAVSPDTRGATRLVRLLLRTLKIKTGTESLLDDAEEMQRALIDARRRTAVSAYALPTPDTDELRSRAAFALRTYRHVAGRMEAERIIHLLEDPIGVVGPDPLPLPPTAYPLRNLDDDDASQQFLALLRERDAVVELAHGPYGEARRPDLCSDDGPPFVAKDDCDPAGQCVARFRSPMAVARTAALLLDWVRAIEDFHPKRVGDDDDPEARQSAAHRFLKAVEWRRRIFAARFAAEVLVAARDRLLLELAQGASVNDRPVPMVRTANARLARMIVEAPMPDPVWEPLVVGCADDQDPVAVTWECWAEHFAIKSVDALDAKSDWPGEADDREWHECALSPLWELLGALAFDIAASVSEESLRVPGFRALERVSSREVAIDALAAAEVLVGPLRVDALSGSSDICFATVSAANRSPLEDLIFDGLDDDERVARKLSGNQIANFASFLSARWRASDWTWGRLDAAQSLVAAIARRDRAPATHSVAELERLFKIPPTGGQEGAWAKRLIDRWEARQKDRDLRVTEENLHEKTLDVLTERLQWEILADEMPLITHLQGRHRKFRPWTPPLDDPPPEPELRLRHVVHSAPPDDSELAEFGTIGDESVVTLLPKTDLRRPLLRLGLVAWRAAMPAGKGWKAKFARSLGMVPKAYLWLPTLFAITAPKPSIVADLLVWVAVVLTTHEFASLPATPMLLAGALTSAWVWAWQARTKRKHRDGGEVKFPVWPYVVAGFASAGGIAAFVLALVWEPGYEFGGSDRTLRIIVAALLTLATVVLLAWVLGRTWRMLGIVVLAAVGSYGAACFAVRDYWVLDSVWDWQALMLLAVPLAIVGFALTRWFPKVKDSA